MDSLLSTGGRTMILSNCHTHSQFCDGKSTMEEMVLSALSKGFVSLGFTAHARQTFDFDYAMDEKREHAYRAEFQRLQALYGGQVRLYLGVERDLFSATDCREYDYFIGSVHCLYTSGGFVTLDNSREQSLHLLREEFDGDVQAFVKAYFREVAAMVTAFRPAIVGHFDLILKYLRDRIDTSASGYRTYATEALEAARAAGCVLEVNTGGMARANQPLPYPEPWALRRWHDMGGQVIVSSDCHQAALLDTHFDEMPSYLRTADYHEILRLNAGKGELFETVKI